MYAKLFSRIAQSSLMEESVETRYCFMMLLAIADSAGDVIGTDVALARTVNLPLETFQQCVSELMEPDPNSNSQVHDGRRLIPSSSGRGYFIVNYGSYRSIKTAEEKKAYMRDYMQRYRKSKNTNDVTSVNICKSPLVPLIQGEGEGEGEEKTVQDKRGEEASIATSIATSIPTEKKPNKARGTESEIVAYALELNLPASDGEGMFAKWESVGWKSGGNDIKDWRAAMRQWKKAGWLPSQKQNGFTKPPEPERKEWDNPNPRSFIPANLHLRGKYCNSLRAQLADGDESVRETLLKLRAANAEWIAAQTPSEAEIDRAKAYFDGAESIEEVEYAMFLNPELTLTFTA